MTAKVIQALFPKSSASWLYIYIIKLLNVSSSYIQAIVFKCFIEDAEWLAPL